MALVISPLLALMRDQLQRLPPCLPAAMLWGGQPAQEAQSVLQGVRAGALKVLFVAPERLHSNQLMDALQAVMPLSLVRRAVRAAVQALFWGRPVQLNAMTRFKSPLHGRFQHIVVPNGVIPAFLRLHPCACSPHCFPSGVC